jgi:hypothetical protein
MSRAGVTPSRHTPSLPMTRDDVTVDTPLLAPREKSRSRVAVVVGVVGVVGVVACASAVAGRTNLEGATWQPDRGRPWLAPAPRGHAKRAAREYLLHTQCMDRATKLAYAEFFYTGAPEAYLLRHNYQSQKFFEHDDAVKMERVVLPSQERAWRVTAHANFEFGFALRNAVTGEWKSEIGKKHAPLGKAPCAQRYGEYFNRVATLEEPAGSTIEYVYGMCNKTCPEGFVESQWVDQPLTGDIPLDGEGEPVDLGEGDDARLITIRTALPLKDPDGRPRGPSGRGIVVRDTRFAESEDVSRWIMAIVDPYPANEIKLAMLEVTKSASNRLLVSQIDSKRYAFGHTCVTTECSVARYDIPAIWHDNELLDFTYTYSVTALQYTIARKGDTKTPAYEHTFPLDKLISTTNIWTMKRAGKWGMDIDVRRVVFTSAGQCGAAHAGRCIRMGVVERATFMDNSATEAYWIASLMGGGKSAMALIKVYVDANNNLLAKIQAAREGSQCPNPPGDFYLDSWVRQWDVLLCSVPLQSRWSGAASQTVKNTATDSRDVGIGALAYLLAPEMTASLAANFAPT